MTQTLVDTAQLNPTIVAEGAEKIGYSFAAIVRVLADKIT